MKYSIVYADPPWLYKDRGESGRRGAAQKYHTTDFMDLVRLRVSDIAARDAVCFMWATYPLINVALALMQAWEFEFKTVAFTWVKTTKGGKYVFGMGNWTRANPEICILGVRGKIRRVSRGVPNLLFAEAGRHSAKPPETRERIVKLMGDIPRIELFARERTEGWHAWGNEITNPDVLLLQPTEPTTAPPTRKRK